MLRHIVHESVDYLLLLFHAAVFYYEIPHRLYPFGDVRIEKYVRKRFFAFFVIKPQRVKSARLLKALINALKAYKSVEVISRLPKSAVKRDVFKGNIFYFF